jgi:ubiquinone/menaquinone biosynthesis C-methylase UbiE
VEKTMDETILKLMVDLHKPNPRQGPGGPYETKKAMILAGLDNSRPLKIADIGCGTGASTIQLAKELGAEVTAVDFLPEFLEVLEQNAKNQGVSDKITTLNCSMDNLPFEDAHFDVIWSEGAIYNMGFENGIKQWKKFLKTGGKLVVSEITWLTEERPKVIQEHWQTEYPQIDTASEKIKILEKNGYTPEAYFCLPPECWIDNYYSHLQSGYESFLERNKDNDLAKEVVKYDSFEMGLYQMYNKYYGYGVYVAQKL